MRAYTESRRAFLASMASLGAMTATSTDSHAQSGHPINEPDVVSEVEALFEDYDRALRSNDVAALNGFFYDSPLTVRFGNAENLYGIAEIQGYRASVATGPSVVRERTVITTFGRDFATVATHNVARAGRVGRAMQTWVRFPQGWRIVAAHVSSIAE